MFILNRQRVRILEFKTKNVKIGEGDRAGAQLKIKVKLPNSALEMLDPSGGLRVALYAKGNPGDKAMKQSKIDGVDQVSDTPALTPTGHALGSITWHTEQSGCTLTIDYGTGDKSAIVLPEGTRKAIKLTLLDGGTIEAEFVFHAPTDKLQEGQVGRLSRQHQRDVTVDLVGPTLDEQQRLDEDSGKAGEKVTPIGALKKADDAARASK